MKFTSAQVDDLFAGTAVTVSRGESLADRGRDYVPSYARCHCCRERSIALLTFDTDRDWEPSIALDDAIRILVRQLRKDLDRQAIYLCHFCITDAERRVHAAEDQPEVRASQVALW